MTIIAITGHRPSSINKSYNLEHDNWNWTRQELRAAFELHDADRVITGMALGVDQLAAQVAIAEGIPFTAAIPFDGQEGRWPEESQELYNDLLLAADDVVFVSEPPYAAWKLHKRNEWMIDNSDMLVAVWNGDKKGGTANAVRYGLKTFEQVWRIDPVRERADWYAEG